MKSVSLSDIAERLGISKYSVSRALTGKPGVSDATRRRVLRVAQEMGYVHPALEQRPTDPGERTVVVLIPLQDLDDAEFWMGVIGGTISAAAQLGYTIATRAIDSADDGTRVSRHIVQGVIVAGSKARSALPPYLEAGVPASLITYPTPLEPFDAVHAADWEGGAMVAKHLADLGYVRLGYVTEGPERPSFAARARGFRDAAAGERGVDVVEMHIDGDEPGLSFERAYAALADEDRAPTGILASTDSIAFAIAAALGRLGLEVPRDMSLVGFNDAVGSSRFVPKLTTLRIATGDIGAAAMRFLHERIEGSRTPARRLELAPTFVLRDSTAAVRAKAVRSAGLEVGR